MMWVRVIACGNFRILNSSAARTAVQCICESAGPARHNRRSHHHHKCEHKLCEIVLHAPSPLEIYRYDFRRHGCTQHQVRFMIVNSNAAILCNTRPCRACQCTAILNTVPSDVCITGISLSPNRSAHRSHNTRAAPPHFYTTVYAAAFLLSLGGGFLSGKTSFITINWFAGVDCASKKDDPTCDHALNVYTAASGITTFASLGVAMLLVPFLTRASDALGRRRFIQVILEIVVPVCPFSFNMLLKHLKHVASPPT